MSELIRLYVYSSLDNNIYGPVGSLHVRDDDNNVTELLLLVVAMKTATEMAATAMMCVVFRFNCEDSTERRERKNTSPVFHS